VGGYTPFRYTPGPGILSEKTQVLGNFLFSGTARNAADVGSLWILAKNDVFGIWNLHLSYMLFLGDTSLDQLSKGEG